MLHVLLTTLVVAFPRPNIPIDRECVNAWAKAKSPAPELSDRCLDFILRAGYGEELDSSSLTLDPPRGGGVLTVEVPTASLEAMAAQVQKVCRTRGEDDLVLRPRPATQALAARFELQGDEALDDLWNWRCTRAEEVMSYELAAKMAVTDSINMPDAVYNHRKLLTGAPLTEHDVLPHVDDEGRPDFCYSRATLWKFRNGPYARHGQRFKNEDLARFFYGKRKEPIVDEFGDRHKFLPLPEGTRDKVTLTPVDNANVALVIKAQKLCYGN